jgi:hypothetical protein
MTVNINQTLTKTKFPKGYGYDFLKDENTLNPIFRLTYNENNTIDSINPNDPITKYFLPDCFESELPEREEFWIDLIIESIDKFVSTYQWQTYDDNKNNNKRSLSPSIPDINSSTSVEDLFSGKYLPKGVQSVEWMEMQDEQKKSKTFTTSVRYNRHAYTVKAPIKCPLDESFKGKLDFVCLCSLLFIRPLKMASIAANKYKS